MSSNSSPDRSPASHDPNGMGAMFFAVLVAAAQTERIHIREKTLEGQVTAAAEGNRGGRPKVIDDDSLLFFACALKDKGVPVPEIAKKLTIKTGKNAGKSPSVASLYRALAEADERDARRRRRSSDRAAPDAQDHRACQRHPPSLMEPGSNGHLGPRDMSRSDCQLPCLDLSSEWLAVFGGPTQPLALLETAGVRFIRAGVQGSVALRGRWLGGSAGPGGVSVAHR